MLFFVVIVTEEILKKKVSQIMSVLRTLRWFCLTPTWSQMLSGKVLCDWVSISYPLISSFAPLHQPCWNITPARKLISECLCTGCCFCKGISSPGIFQASSLTSFNFYSNVIFPRGPSWWHVYNCKSPPHSICTRFSIFCSFWKLHLSGASLAVQCLGLRIPMQRRSFDPWSGS